MIINVPTIRKISKTLNYITNASTCFSASAPSLGSFDIVFGKSYRILKLYTTVDRFMVKSVRLLKYGSGCMRNPKVRNELILSIITKL